MTGGGEGGADGRRCISWNAAMPATAPGSPWNREAVSPWMWISVRASGQIPGFLDWNNNYGNEVDKCVCTHCSNFPKSFMGRDIEISALDLLGETLGKDNCFDTREIYTQHPVILGYCKDCGSWN